MISDKKIKKGARDLSVLLGIALGTVGFSGKDVSASVPKHNINNDNYLKFSEENYSGYASKGLAKFISGYEFTLLNESSLEDSDDGDNIYMAHGDGRSYKKFRRSKKYNRSNKYRRRRRHIIRDYRDNDCRRYDRDDWRRDGRRYDRRDRDDWHRDGRRYDRRDRDDWRRDGRRYDRRDRDDWHRDGRRYDSGWEIYRK